METLDVLDSEMCAYSDLDPSFSFAAASATKQLRSNLVACRRRNRRIQFGHKLPEALESARFRWKIDRGDLSKSIHTSLQGVTARMQPCLESIGDALCGPAKCAKTTPLFDIFGDCSRCRCIHVKRIHTSLGTDGGCSPTKYQIPYKSPLGQLNVQSFWAIFRIARQRELSFHRHS